MKLQRYDFDELTKHECDDGEWVKASDAEAEIARLNQICSNKSSEIYKLRGEALRLSLALEDIVPCWQCDVCSKIAKNALEGE